MDEMEKLAEQVHHLYCEQYKKDTGKEYWTGGDYSKLTEAAKEYGRNIVRWHLQEMKKVTTPLIMRIVELKVETITMGLVLEKFIQVHNSYVANSPPMTREARKAFLKSVQLAQKNTES